MGVTAATDQGTPWYRGITRYQWTVLAIASLGWVFDVFEGQVFVAFDDRAMTALLPANTAAAEVRYYNNIAFAAFLVGGALGGVLFGIISDRIGRKRAMVLTILVYSLFTAVSALAQAWWQLTICRFLVAFGTGGEWAVASALVAEVFPQKARAWSLAIFHASSILGTYLAILAGVILAGFPEDGWRWGFLIGAGPALLILWVRTGLREPERWRQAHAEEREDQRAGRLGDLFTRRYLRRTLVGVTLATIGLATFWGVHIHGKARLRTAVEERHIIPGGLLASGAGAESALEANAAALKRWEMLGMFLATTGGGLGVVAFGPLCERLGRRGAFLLFQLGGLAATLVLFQWLADVNAILAFLPIFGFLTLGMHAGFAVYFPELFPTRLRSTGAGFCFNVGRLAAAPILFISGWLQKDWGYRLPDVCTLLGLLFLVGALVVLFAPETKGRDLPD
jgi:MFS family permease